MVPWLIVGGGPHGVHVAVRLVASAGVRLRDITIVDTQPRLLHTWRERARRTGMTHLRSPSVHHLDVDPWSLRNFAGGWLPPQRERELFRHPYSRPRLELFDAHCQMVVDQYALQERMVTATVEAIEPRADGTLRVQTSAGQFGAGRVVLALGSDGAQSWPTWAATARETGTHRVQHIFDADFSLDAREDLRSIAIVGGGITAAQLALRLSQQGKDVTLICRHRFRREQFDSDPMWLGPAKMTSFRRMEDPAERRRAIDHARYRGTMPSEVHRELRSAIHRRKIRSIQSPIRGCTVLRDAVALGLSQDSVEVDAVGLATGFAGVPGAELLRSLRPEEGFVRAPCGTPRVDESLHWHANVYCTGALAELELGPVARNLAGARRSGERLAMVASRPG